MVGYSIIAIHDEVTTWKHFPYHWPFVRGNLLVRTFIWHNCKDFTGICLSHWSRVTRVCVGRLRHHWFKYWLAAWLAPSHYLNQCWNIVNWTLGNKLRRNLNRNLYLSSKEMHLKMSSGNWRPFCLGLNVIFATVYRTPLTDQPIGSPTTFWKKALKTLQNRWHMIITALLW